MRGARGPNHFILGPYSPTLVPVLKAGLHFPPIRHILPELSYYCRTDANKVRENTTFPALLTND